MTMAYFDTAEIARQMREGQGPALDAALLNCNSDDERAFFHAQNALFEASVLAVTVSTDLRSAGRGDVFIGRTFGASFGAILWNLARNADDPDRIVNECISHLVASFNTKSHKASVVLEFPAIPGGRA